MTIDDLIDDYEREISETAASPSTARTHRNALGHFRRFLASRDLASSRSLSVQIFIDFAAYIEKADLRRSSRKTYLSAVHSFFDWLVERGEIEPSPSEIVRYQKAQKKRTARKERLFPKTAGDGDAEKVLAAVREITLPSPIRERDIALLEFLYSTGCRESEAVSLNIRDIDLEDQSAVVLGKGRVQRTVFLTPESVAALRTYWTARGDSSPSSPAFARHDRGAGKKKTKRLGVSSVWKIVDQVAAVAGIKFWPHAFRNAFITRILAATDGNYKIAQDAAGHLDPKTTARYASIDPLEVRRAHKTAHS